MATLDNDWRSIEITLFPYTVALTILLLSSFVVDKNRKRENSLSNGCADALKCTQTHIKMKRRKKNCTSECFYTNAGYIGKKIKNAIGNQCGVCKTV